VESPASRGTTYFAKTVTKCRDRWGTRNEPSAPAFVVTILGGNRGEQLKRWAISLGTLAPSAGSARRTRRTTEGSIWEECHGMVKSENIDSGRSSFQLDDRSGRHHCNLARLLTHVLTGFGNRPVTPANWGGLAT